MKEMGYTFDAPFEFFRPDPEDAKLSPLFPGDADDVEKAGKTRSGV